jgi:lysophospholipase L1-like esterase
VVALLVLVGPVIALAALDVLSMPSSPHDRMIPHGATTTDGVNISVVGTSLTDYYPWPELLAQRLRSDLDRPIRMSRVAKGGATSEWGAASLDDIVAQEPDIVLIEFAINDADLRHLLTRRQSTENHRRLIAGLRSANPSVDIVLVTMSPAYGVRRLLRPRLAGYYESYRQLAREADTGLIDLYPRWLAYEDRRQALPDGVHPTEAASNRLIVPTVATYLEDMVRGD